MSVVVPLSSYSTASHAKGRFFVLLSREKISSNHDTSVLIVFIFSHNMALFLLSFFSFFLSFLTVIVVVVVLLGKTVWLQSRAATNLRGLHISENRAIHTCKFFNHHRSVYWFPVPFWLLLQSTIHFGL